ncbi:Hypothetical protein, putative [Bodo saltans]|uniref:CCDC113/CCDC96 coiled-coil domain-containing protein n=1 Tax=Bodo saltans TaxID=75058 RepID=A0A0S4IZV5_BODSA|nr:Hypothetical protein, putative [Bodo saltans]|eukprot:CUG25491.1 Hypothetical protein, putative [Bodo saltans]
MNSFSFYRCIWGQSVAKEMNEYDRGEQNEEERQHQAATTIQRKWRTYFKDVSLLRGNEAAQGGYSGDDGGDGEDGVGGGSGAPKQPLTEEEIREQCLERCRQLLTDRDSLIQTNLTHQRALFKIFAERRAGQGQEAADNQPVTAELEAKYWSQLQRVRDERASIGHMRAQSDAEIERSTQSHQHVIQEAMQYEHNFLEFVKEKAGEAVSVRNNKPIPAKRIEEFEQQEHALHARVHQVRVQYLKLRNKSRKLHNDMSHKDNKKDGMHLIDFEQLKIENTNLNEKIEERNEDLLKLRKKATTTIHVLTHVKEKLEFVKAENTQLQRQVAQLEEELSSLRDRLAQTKRERDYFANDNIKIREKMPMIGAEDLLLDYEVRKKDIENCRIEVVELTNRHHELMQWIHSHQGTLETMQKTVA